MSLRLIVGIRTALPNLMLQISPFWQRSRIVSSVTHVSIWESSDAGMKYSLFLMLIKILRKSCFVSAFLPLLRGHGAFAGVGVFLPCTFVHRLFAMAGNPARHEQ